jgi:hypothetical protein
VGGLQLVFWGGGGVFPPPPPPRPRSETQILLFRALDFPWAMQPMLLSHHEQPPSPQSKRPGVCAAPHLSTATTGTGGQLTHQTPPGSWTTGLGENLSQSRRA